MSTPKVSILIPVYNQRKYIADCILSALDQTFTESEIVVVDNASNDGTWEICQEYASRDPRVRAFRNETNVGPVRNWLRCAHEARGEYSKILFSDDLLEPGCVQRMLQPFENPDVGLVFCAARIGESRENSAVEYLFKGNRLFGQARYLGLLISGRAPASPGAVMLRTQDLIRNLHPSIPTATPRPFERNGAGPDVMISLLTTSTYSHVACISEPLAFFRAHPGSFTVANTNNEVADGYISAKAYFLRYNKSWFAWLSYLMGAWLTGVRQQRRWISPGPFLRANEGRGSLPEVLVGFALIPRAILGLVVQRVLYGPSRV